MSAPDQIVVDPAQLRRFADDINRCHSVYKTSLQNSVAKVNSLKGVWTGGAADTFNTSFNQLLGKCNESMKALERLIKALYESADAYERNEKSVTNEASKMAKLPANKMR